MAAARFGKFSYPPGFQSLDDLSDSVLENHARLIDPAKISDGDHKPVVGVIDSVYEPGEMFREYGSVEGRQDLLTDEDSDMTTHHGINVARTILKFSPSASFRFYRVTRLDANDSPVILQRDLHQAMGYAHLKDGVDIMNISLGNDHSGDNGVLCDMPNEPCKIRDAARKATDDDICIVAGAGNEGQFESICCPALCDQVIAVGGTISKCTAAPSSNGLSGNPNTDIKPPMACWVKGNESGYSKILCTDRNCGAKGSCKEFRKDIAWDANVPKTQTKPDIFAPAALFVFSEGNGTIVEGTSYAVPVVTSVVCEIVAGLKEIGIDYYPSVIKRYICESGTEIDDGTFPVVNGERAIKAISNHYGLSLNITPSTPVSGLYSLSVPDEYQRN